MALNLFSTFLFNPFITQAPNKLSRTSSSNAVSALYCHQGPAATQSSCQPILRRSANYQPPIWDYDFIQSLSNEYVAKSAFTKRANELRGQVKMWLQKFLSPLDKLELIDTLQRLGLSYHFKNEISNILLEISKDNNIDTWKNNLHATALEFRLLRQHGYNMPQEIFNNFRNEHGTFKACVNEDIKGMLSLYEASYLLIKGETILEEAGHFAREHLREYMKQTNKDDYLLMLVSHALELPLHWRMPRLEARWFIDAYERKEDMSPTLLELAKLDYNEVQATYQEDLKFVSSWWKHMGLGEEFNFARDRVTENFLWAIGTTFEPQFGYCRRMMTKVNSFITLIDDIYDVYGTWDELVLFTEAVERWDVVHAMEELPDYMKMCFLALYNTINEIAFIALKEQGSDDVVLYLKKAWTDLCKSYLQEAKWQYSGYIPSLQEYLDNAWISISGALILNHTYILITNPVTDKAVEYLKEYPDFVRQSAMILRLLNDLGTSRDELKRGDISKSIQCYMHETGTSEENAREHIQHLIGETWKNINEGRGANASFSKIFHEAAENVVRAAQCFYQHGDGYGVPDCETKNHVLSTIVQPICLDSNRRDK